MLRMGFMVDTPPLKGNAGAPPSAGKPKPPTRVQAFRYWLPYILTREVP
jgi:hypothetical protein